jgi:hypothetical protein
VAEFLDLDIGRALGDTIDPKSVFPAALADLDQHLARLVQPATLRNVLRC